MYLAGRAAKLGAAEVLGAFGVIEYSAQNSLRKWLKGLFQQ